MEDEIYAPIYRVSTPRGVKGAVADKVRVMASSRQCEISKILFSILLCQSRTVNSSFQAISRIRPKAVKGAG